MVCTTLQNVVQIAAIVATFVYAMLCVCINKAQ